MVMVFPFLVPLMALFGGITKGGSPNPNVNPNALVPPPAPPPSTLTTEGANVGAAKLAADAQRKRAMGGTLLADAPATSVTPPVAGGTPRTLIGY